MPDISQMKNSKFLSKGDCAQGPILLIMDRVTQENVAKEGADEEMKWCLHFRNHDKPMVLNQINMQLIARATGSTVTEDWPGKQIVVYHDPNVAMGDKIVGGLRCRAPKMKQPAPAAPALTPAPLAPPPAAQVNAQVVEDDDVPF